MSERHDASTLRRILGSMVLVPTPDDPTEAGRWTPIELDVVSVPMIEDDLGLVMPGFTSLEALARWRPEGGTCVEREATWLLGVASADETGRVAIDPGSDDEVLLEAWEIASLLAGVVPGEEAAAPAGSDAGPSVLIATPAEGLAAPVQAAVVAVLSGEPLVASARLLLVDDDGQGPHPVVMVDLGDLTDPAEVDATMQRVVARIAASTDDAAGLRFAVVDDQWRSAYEGGGLALFSRLADG